MAGRASLQNLTGLLNYYFNRQFSGFTPLHDLKNNTQFTAADATDTISIPLLVADSDSLAQFNQQVLPGARNTMQFNLNANASLATQSFYVAARPLTITGIQYIHSAAGNDAGAVTAQVFHDKGTQAPGTGTVVMTNTFNCKGTANTVQNATLLSVDGNGDPVAGVVLAVGDRLSIVFTGVLTTLAGVVLTAVAAPGNKSEDAIYNMLANGSLATQSFFLANRDLQIASVQMFWSTAGTDAGAVTIDVTKDTGTQAPGAGTSVLSAAVSAKTAANTVNAVTLSATVANLLLAAGNRLSVKFTGTLTALAGVVVVVNVQSTSFSGYIGQAEATFTIAANGSQATQGFFIADRDYEVVDFSEVHSTAGTDGGAVTLDCTIDKGVVAPGAGSSCLAATVNLKGTANTVAIPGVNTSRRQRLMSKGDVLSVKYTGTLTALVGVTATASVRPV